ncbi:MAG TPA: YdjY domain-containing protein [Planctomycetota bacterium]|nr:YdjY domain-containing protein [Planctomycetota bacterium]
MNVALMAALLALCGPEEAPQGGIVVDKEKKTVRVPARIAPRKLPTLSEVYPIEVIATWPTPKGQKAHETIVIFDVLPSEVHKAIESLGLKEGKPGRGDDRCSGPELEVFLDLPAVNGRPPGLVSIDKLLVDMKTGRTLPLITWHFTGSVLKDGKYAADSTGTMIGLYPVTDEVVVQSNFTMREESLIKLETNKKLLPGENTPVTVVIKVASGPPPASATAGFDPEKAVLKLSRTVGPGEAAAPSVGAGPPPPAAITADPFENRKEVRPGKALQDSTRPIDAPPAQK